MPYNRYFRPNYALLRHVLQKQAAQPPMMGGDPSMMGADPSMMGGDPSMMGGGMPPGVDPSMMGVDPSMMGGDPSMGGGGMSMDPNMLAAMMGGGMPAGDPAAAAPAPADPVATKMTAKQQKEELMNSIQASLDDIKDYTYNNLMILIKIANALGVQIPAETLVAPPDGKNMDIMTDPSAISAAAASPTGDVGAAMGGQMGAAPEDMGQEGVKMSMYRMMGIPQDMKRSDRIKQAMAYLLNKDKARAINNMSYRIDQP